MGRRRRYDCFGACGLEVGVAAPEKTDRGVFDLQTGAEKTVRLAAVVHRECSTLPSAEEIEVTLPLSDIDDSDFQESEPHQGVVGAAPTTVHRAAELERFDDARGCTQRASALQAARGIEAVEVEPGEMRRGVKQNVERIRPRPGGEFAVSGPVEQGRPVPADMKGPGARHAGHAIDDNHAQREKLEKVCGKSAATSCHALEYIRDGSHTKNSQWPLVPYDCSIGLI